MLRCSRHHFSPLVFTGEIGIDKVMMVPSQSLFLPLDRKKLPCIQVMDPPQALQAPQEDKFILVINDYQTEVSKGATGRRL